MNIKKSITLILAGIVLNIFLPAYSYDSNIIDVNQRIETRPEDIPQFSAPVCLLVGLNSPELAYREISALSGFELFSVPYRSDIEKLVGQINPTQVIMKHPSGFVGLYTIDGQLVRGVQTVRPNEVALGAQIIPPSIIQPTEADPAQSAIYYPGSLTGGVPHGGIGYEPPPQGRGIKRHLLKLAALTGLVPFQYPGFFRNGFQAQSPTRTIVPYLFATQIPFAIGAASTYADAKLDESAYEEARTQPRNYKFQPVIEGY